MSAVSLASSSQMLWVLSRASGLVLLVVFSIVIVLGVATRLGSAPRQLARFVVAETHRTLSLFAVALLALHVCTALLDPYVSIGWLTAVVPFISHYRAFAIGVGTLAVDIAGALIVTSLLRQHIGFTMWRVIHWLAYLAWPLAFLHSLRAGTDQHVWWVATIEWGSAALVATAVGTRLLERVRPTSERALPAERELSNQLQPGTFAGGERAVARARK